MNIIVQNRRNVEFDLADLEVQVKDYVEDNNVVYYLIEVRLLAQIWILKKRFSDFDKMHARLKADLEFKAAENLPDLPPKKLFFNRNPQFLRDRMRALNRFIKLVILIYEAIENPILQRFLEIDTNFNPNYEYETIDVGVVDDSSEENSLFLEGDKLSKVKKRFQKQKEGITKRLTKQEEQEQFLLGQLTVKDLPNHRFYNPMIEAPISEDMEYDSDYLDEYHGRDAEQYLMDFDIDLEDHSDFQNQQPYPHQHQHQNFPHFMASDEYNQDQQQQQQNTMRFGNGSNTNKNNYYENENQMLNFSPPHEINMQQRLMNPRAEEYKTADAKNTNMLGGIISPNTFGAGGGQNIGHGNAGTFGTVSGFNNNPQHYYSEGPQAYNSLTEGKEESKRPINEMLMNNQIKANFDHEDDENLALRIGSSSMRAANRVTQQVDNLLKTYKTQNTTQNQPTQQQDTQQININPQNTSASNEMNQKIQQNKGVGEADFHVNDEYEQIDENQCDDINKILVKKASKACNKLIKENSELFRLNYKINEMSQELDEADLYFSDLRSKIIERCQLIKKIMANPTKLHKIKKNQIVNAIQQEIENDAVNVVDDQPFFIEDIYNDPYYQNHGSLPSMSTGMFMGSNVQNKLAAVNRKQNEVNKFI